MRNLDELKALKQTLRAITSSLADAMKLAKGSSLRDRRNARGILHLPHELLANIFEQAVTSTSTVGPINDKVEKALSISHVCKQFRTIALSIPYLWDDISDEWRPGLVKLLLSRCNKPMIRARYNSNLKQAFKLKTSRPKSSFLDSSFMRLVESMPTDSTLCGFSVDCFDLNDGREAIAALEDMHKAGRLTHLEHLGISCNGGNGVFQSDGVFEKVSSLELLALRSLCCGGFHPRTIRAPQLVECVVSLHSVYPGARWRIQGLLNFLGSIPSVQFLTLEFKSASVWHSPESRDSDSIDLPNVQHLSIVIRQGTKPDLLEEVMSNLVFPNVKRMSIEGHFYKEDAAEDCFRALFASEWENGEVTRETFHKLERLDLRIFEEDSREVFPCYVAFSRMPSLRYLSVEAPGLHFPTNWDFEESRVKELRVLRLNNCHYFEHKHIGDPLEDAMEVLGSFKRLERVEFNDCPDIIKWKADIEEVFPKEKLHRSTSTD